MLQQGTTEISATHQRRQVSSIKMASASQPTANSTTFVTSSSEGVTSREVVVESSSSSAVSSISGSAQGGASLSSPRLLEQHHQVAAGGAAPDSPPSDSTCINILKSCQLICSKDADPRACTCRLLATYNCSSSLPSCIQPSPPPLSR